MAFKHPGVRSAIVIGVLFLVFWAVFMGLAPETTFLGAPAIAWSQIALGIIAIGLSVAAVFQLERWDER
jgi:uncharacterized membrane protein (DUF485 family)